MYSKRTLEGRKRRFHEQASLCSFGNLPEFYSVLNVFLVWSLISDPESCDATEREPHGDEPHFSKTRSIDFINVHFTSVLYFRVRRDEFRMKYTRNTFHTFLFECRIFPRSQEQLIEVSPQGRAVSAFGPFHAVDGVYTDRAVRAASHRGGAGKRERHTNPTVRGMRPSGPKRRGFHWAQRNDVCDGFRALQRLRGRTGSSC